MDDMQSEVPQETLLIDNVAICKQMSVLFCLFDYFSNLVSVCVCVCVCVLVAQLHLTLWNPVVCGFPSFSLHGILQARILEWVAIPFSSGSSRPRDQTQVSHIAGRVFTI